MHKHGYRKISPEENGTPALILTLILNQTLTLTGGNFPRGQFSGYPVRFQKNKIS